MNKVQTLFAAVAFCVAISHSQGQPPIIDLCANCTIVNGAAYNSHPTDCDKFVQCHHNHYGHMVGEIQQCAFATYWSMELLTCIPYDEAICQSDKCVGLPDLTMIDAETNCRGYWECMGERAMPHCCTVGFMYDAAIAGCVEDIDEVCNDTCFNDAPQKPVCDMRAVKDHPEIYEQYVEGWGFIPRPCAIGTVFNQTECMCAEYTKVKIPGKECKAEVYLPFDKDTSDMSGNGFYVGNENVRVINGAALFTGRSRLIIPRFTNLEHSTTVVIKIKFTSAGPAPTIARAIVSNSDCGNLPSIMISEDESNVYFGVGTSSKPFEMTGLPREQTAAGPVAYQELAYVFEDGVLTGSNGVNSTSMDVQGTLRNVVCALHIGDADNLDNFIGEIDELSVYLCNPDKP